MKLHGHVTPPVSRMLVPIHFFPVIVLSFPHHSAEIKAVVGSDPLPGPIRMEGCGGALVLSAGSSLAVRRSELSAVLNAAAASSTQPVRGHAAGISPNRARLTQPTQPRRRRRRGGRVLFRQFVPPSGVKVLELREPR